MPYQHDIFISYVQFERMYVPTIPILSRLDVQAEFRLSQRWLDRFAREFRTIYADWLPRSVRPRVLLEIIKLPHVSFFSYGETLPVLEHGTTDPGGLGYAYETLTALIARKLQNVEALVDDREEYIRAASRVEPQRPVRDSEAKIFISYHYADLKWLEKLRTHLMPLMRSRALTIWDDTKIKQGENWQDEIDKAISEAEVAVLLISPDYLASDYVLNNELPPLLQDAEENGLKVIPIVLRPSLFAETEIARFQSINDPAQPLSGLALQQQEEVLVKIALRIAEVAGRDY